MNLLNFPTEQERETHDRLLHDLTEEIDKHRLSIPYLFYSAMREQHNLTPKHFAYARPHHLYGTVSNNRLEAALILLENFAIHLPSGDWKPGRQVWCDGLEERDYACWIAPVPATTPPGWMMGTMLCHCKDFTDNQLNRGIPVVHWCKHLVAYYLLCWAYYRIYAPSTFEGK